MSDRTFAGTKRRHGTTSGWALHKQLGEDPCPACYTAKSEYDRRRNAAPEEVRRRRLHARAQARANQQLAHRHPSEYRALYEAAKAELLAEQEASDG